MKSKQSEIWGVFVCAAWLALCAAGCSKAGDGDDDGGSGGTGAPVNAMPPTGACTPMQTGMCTGALCANGSAPESQCLPNGTWSPSCNCPAPAGSPMGGAGIGAGVGGAGAGAAGAAGVNPAGAGGAGTTAGTAAGAGGMNAGGEGGDGGGTPQGQNAWTQMAFDARGTYYNPYETTITPENASTLTEKWVFPVAGVPHGGVLIVEGKVYATASGGLYAINLADGTEAWSRLDLNGQNTFAYADGFLYLHQYTTAELFKLNAMTGATVWGPVKTFNYAGADGTSSPIVGGGKVIVGHATSLEIGGAATDLASARGGVVAFDTEMGNEAWRYYTVELPENGAMVWSSVTIDEEAGIVFAATGNNYTVTGGGSDAIHAIDIATGTRVWAEQVREGDLWNLGMGVGNSQDTDFGSNPILSEGAGGRKLVAAGDKGSAFWALDRMTGDVVWSRTDLSGSHDEAHGGVLNNGAYDGQRFYVVSNAPSQGRISMLHALNPADGMPAWPAKMLMDTSWGMPSVANGVLAVPVNTQLHLYNAATGDLLKMFETGGTIAAGAAAIAEGHIVVKSGLSYPLDLLLSATMNNEIHCYGLP